MTDADCQIERERGEEREGEAGTARFHDSLPRWQAVAGEVVVRNAPGQHAGEGNMVSEPHAAVLATIITEQLSPIERRVP